MNNTFSPFNYLFKFFVSISTIIYIDKTDDILFLPHTIKCIARNRTIICMKQILICNEILTCKSGVVYSCSNNGKMEIKTYF